MDRRRALPGERERAGLDESASVPGIAGETDRVRIPDMSRSARGFSVSETASGVAARRYAPAAERNRGPILEVLRRLVPDGARVLEVASGTGQHAAFFAAGLPATRWQPSEGDPAALASIAAWAASEGASNVCDPVVIDAESARWPVGVFDVVYCANLIHIAPWSCGLGLLHGAQRHLVPGGLLVLYGPFRVDGRHTSASNVAFDRGLRAQDPRWGVRNLREVEEVAAELGLSFREKVAMPANNLVVVFERRNGSD